MAPMAVVAAALLLLLSHPAAEARVPKQHFAVKVRAAAGGVGSLCGHTDYPALCISAAQGLHGAAASEKVIIEMNIQAAIDKVNAAKAKAASLGASALRFAQDTMAKGNLDTCRQSFDSALDDLQRSMKALKSGVIKDLETSLSAVITNVVTCDDGYAEAGKKSPLARPDDDTQKFASNGLALARMLKPGH